MLAVMVCKRTVRVFVEGSRGTGHITQSDRWGGVWGERRGVKGACGGGSGEGHGRGGTGGPRMRKV